MTVSHHADHRGPSSDADTALYLRSLCFCNRRLLPMPLTRCTIRVSDDDDDDYYYTFYPSRHLPIDIHRNRRTVHSPFSRQCPPTTDMSRIVNVHSTPFYSIPFIFRDAGPRSLKTNVTFTSRLNKYHNSKTL